MSERFSRLASKVAIACGHYIVFLSALFVIIIWGASGPFFNYSNGWELIVNTGTTIVTFLMVFLIQNTQNRDSLAIHLKLDELILKMDNANNEFIHSEDVSNEELQKYKDTLDQEIAKERTQSTPE